MVRQKLKQQKLLSSTPQEKAEQDRVKSRNGRAGQMWRDAWGSNYNRNFHSLDFTIKDGYWTKEIWSELTGNSVVEFEVYDEYSEEHFGPIPDVFTISHLLEIYPYSPVTLEDIVARKDRLFRRYKNLRALGFVPHEKLLWSEPGWTVYSGQDHVEDNRQNVWTCHSAPRGWSLPFMELSSTEDYEELTLEAIDNCFISKYPERKANPPSLWLETSTNLWKKHSVDESTQADNAVWEVFSRHGWNLGNIDFDFWKRCYSEAEEYRLRCFLGLSAGFWFWKDRFWYAPVDYEYGYDSPASEIFQRKRNHVEKMQLAKLVSNYEVNQASGDFFHICGRTLDFLFGFGRPSKSRNNIDLTPFEILTLINRLIKRFSSITHESRKLRQKKLYEVKGFLSGEEISARPDTGSSINTISAELVRNRGYVIQNHPTDRRRFRTADGRETLTDGIVKLNWSFADSPTNTYNLVFHVVPGSPSDILLGMPFLKRTETMSRNSHRITARKIATNHYPTVCAQDSGDVALSYAEGELKGLKAFALADSGSEVNIMSRNYALERGFDIDYGIDSQETLLLANGVSKPAIGQARVPWKFKDGSEEHLLTFEILDDCHYDVIIGQDIIFDTKAFSNHADSFVECVSDIDFECDGMFRHAVNYIGRIPRLLRRKPAHDQTTVVTQEQLDIDAELHRRAKAERTISLMADGPGKDAARIVENEARRIWDQAHSTSNTSSSATSSTQISTAGGTRAAHSTVSVN